MWGRGWWGWEEGEGPGVASACLEVLETSVAVGVWGPGQVAYPCDDPCNGGRGEVRRRERRVMKEGKMRTKIKEN